MNHLKVLGIKFISISVVVLSLFGIFNHASWGSLILISLLMTIASYLIVDRILLKRFGNVAASIADFGFAFASYWLLSQVFIGGDGALLLMSLAAAYFTAIIEGFVHIYIINQFDEVNEEEIELPSHQLQTEFSEEIHSEKEKTSDKPSNHS